MLVLDDDPTVTDVVRRYLERAGYRVRTACDGRDGLAEALVDPPILLVLDLMLPGLDGLEVFRRLRAEHPVPVVMLTARGDEVDRVAGLELGADDYLTKPFALRELVLALRALDRRRAHPRPPVREVGGLRLDPFRREVFRDGRYVALTRKQFAVLAVLVDAEGGVVSAEQLLERAWDEHADPFTNAVRVTVMKLRKKLGKPPLIETVPGAGYRL